MIVIFNKFRIGLFPLHILLAILIGSITLSSCDKEELEIQQDYPFDVNVMPVPSEVANGQTVEIRVTIQRTGNYRNNAYYIRYFQFDGQGHFVTTMNRLICLMICTNYHKRSFGCIILQPRRYPNLSIYGYLTALETKNR